MLLLDGDVEGAERLAVDASTADPENPKLLNVIGMVRMERAELVAWLLTFPLSLDELDEYYRHCPEMRQFFLGFMMVKLVTTLWQSPERASWLLEELERDPDLLEPFVELMALTTLKWLHTTLINPDGRGKA